MHVECGTQALAGAVHNAAKGRVPVLIFAGRSPFTQEGELRGSRNEFIQWIQDVHDQRGIVRGYMKYDNEIRTGRNVKQLVHRALQFAHSDPKGPVYLMGAREVMEEETAAGGDRSRRSGAPIAPRRAAGGGRGRARCAIWLARAAAAGGDLLSRAQSGGGRRAGAALRGARHRRAGIRARAAMNFPTDDPLYQGNQWNEPRQNPALAEADVVLVIDSDVPWIPTVSRPAAGARIFHIDVDPLKEQMPLWYIGARRTLRADAATALRPAQPARRSSTRDRRGAVEERRAHLRRRHAARDAANCATRGADAGGRDHGGVRSPPACARRSTADTIVLSEGITQLPHHRRPPRA